MAPGVLKAADSATPDAARSVTHRELVCVAVILIAMWAALCHEAWITGITVDEPSHLLSADLYWQEKDVLQPRDMPPLIKITGGWVPRVLGLPLPAASDTVWQTHHEWQISQRMVAALPDALAHRVFFWSRLPLTIFPLLIAGLVWWWGRQLFCTATGLALAAMFALEPTALGHGALFKNDLAATFGYLLFWYAAWRLWRKPCGANLALITIGLFTALAAKLSMIILIPIAAGIVAVRYYVAWRSIARAALSTVLMLAAVYAGLVCAVQLEARRLGPADFAELRQHAALPSWFIAAAHLFSVVPAPMPMWQGTISLIDSGGPDTQTYLFGKVRQGAQPLYFVGAWAVKSPAPLQILVLCGAVMLALAAWRRKLEFGWVFVVGPPVLYIGAASFSSLQFGIRLILPSLPFGLLIAGAAVEAMRRRWGAWTCGLLCALAALPAVLVYPHGISFFNVWAGGPKNGLKYLSDSNIDWGQDLSSLAGYAREHAIPELRLFYFGNDNPYRYFSPGRLKLLAPPWSDDLVKGTVIHPDPGIYAVSATLLPGTVFDPKYKDYFQDFRAMRPVGRAGYSILIYRVNGARGRRAP